MRMYSYDFHLSIAFPILTCDVWLQILISFCQPNFYLQQLRVRLIIIRREMSMNTRDERLYHYEYRRPRMSNPTYNSVNVFDSLNMFVRNDLSNSLMRSHGRYSLPKDEATLANKSDVINSRYYRPPANYSTIQPPTESPRRDVLLNDKDYLYLQMIDEKNRQARGSKGYDYNLGGSRISENAENTRQFNLKGGDSLSNELKEFQSHKR